MYYIYIYITYEAITKKVSRSARAYIYKPAIREASISSSKYMDEVIT